MLNVLCCSGFNKMKPKLNQGGDCEDIACQGGCRVVAKEFSVGPFLDVRYALWLYIEQYRNLSFLEVKQEQKTCAQFHHG